MLKKLIHSIKKYSNKKQFLLLLNFAKYILILELNGLMIVIVYDHFKKSVFFCIPNLIISLILKIFWYTKLYQYFKNSSSILNLSSFFIAINIISVILFFIKFIQ